MKRVSLQTRFYQSHSNIERLVIIYFLLKSVHERPLNQQCLLNLELQHITLDENQMYFKQTQPQPPQGTQNQRQLSNLYTLGRTLETLITLWQTDKNNPPYKVTVDRIDTLIKGLLCPLPQRRWNLQQTLQHFESIPIQEPGGRGFSIVEYIQMVTAWKKQQAAYKTDPDRDQKTAPVKIKNALTPPALSKTSSSLSGSNATLWHPRSTQSPSKQSRSLQPPNGSGTVTISF